MPRLNLTIDTTLAPARLAEAREPQVERIACSWRRMTGFLTHTCTRDGQTQRRQLVLSPHDVARLEKLVQYTNFGMRRSEAVVCRLVVVDATGHSTRGYPDPAKPWIDWAASMRVRTGDEWREVRGRPSEFLATPMDAPAPSLWARTFLLRLLGRKTDN